MVKQFRQIQTDWESPEKQTAAAGCENKHGDHGMWTSWADLVHNQRVHLNLLLSSISQPISSSLFFLSYLPYLRFLKTQSQTLGRIQKSCSCSSEKFTAPLHFLKITIQQQTPAQQTTGSKTVTTHCSKEHTHTAWKQQRAESSFYAAQQQTMTQLVVLLADIRRDVTVFWVPPPLSSQTAAAKCNAMWLFWLKQS